MQKTLKDMARHLKNVITPEIPEAYEIDPIERGYGCGIKRGITDHCNGGCQGFRFSLDSSITDIKNIIETWLDKEMSFA